MPTKINCISKAKLTTRTPLSDGCRRLLPPLPGRELWHGPISFSIAIGTWWSISPLLIFLTSHQRQSPLISDASFLSFCCPLWLCAINRPRSGCSLSLYFFPPKYLFKCHDNTTTAYTYIYIAPKTTHKQAPRDNRACPHHPGHAIFDLISFSTSSHSTERKGHIFMLCRHHWADLRV